MFLKKKHAESSRPELDAIVTENVTGAFEIYISAYVSGGHSPKTFSRKT